MTAIHVWAPDAAKVEILLREQRHALTAGEMGWWTLAGPQPHHGDDYCFFLDDQGPYPDPRSPWQPAGVHGPSRWIDHRQHRWQDDGWQPPPLAGAVIYELHIGTFTAEGTFDAAIQRLDALVELGITHVELMPVASFAGARGWGYDGVALYAPHHPYGGPEGLKRLVEACHRRGLAVLLDVVYNHLGPSGNYLGRYGPYFTDRYTTPWGDAVNLDGPHSDTVRRFFIDNALMWLRDYHMDGLRIDAIHAFADNSATHLLEQLADAVRRLQAHLGRHLVLIAESDLNDPRAVRPPAAGGYGLDAQWNEDFHHALHAVLTGEQQGYYQDFGRLADLVAVLTRGWRYDGRFSPYRQRRHGRPATGLSGHCWVGCMQNHDQVGNRARGDRLSRILSPQRVMIGAALLLTAPFVPMLFQGEEWGAGTPFLYFTDHQEPELGEAVRQGRQKEFAAFGWQPDQVPDPQDAATFRQSKLAWDEMDQAPHKALRQWYKALIRLRRQHPALSDGRLEAIRARFDEADRWLVVGRGPVVLVCNMADKAQRIAVTGLGDKQLLLASAPQVHPDDAGVRLPADSVAIWADGTSAIDDSIVFSF